MTFVAFVDANRARRYALLTGQALVAGPGRIVRGFNPATPEAR
jgi:hypothetical protein